MTKDFVKLTPLLNIPGIYCHLLELNDTKILVNCGTDQYMDVSIYKNILPIILDCDVILVTSFGIECIGALPYIISNNYYKFVYMTLPNKILGNIVLEEHMNIMKTFYTFDLKKTSNILDTSEKIVDIKYMQPFSIKDISICAFNCGYSLGSTLFRITKGVTSIYIGYNINHRKENHLDGVDLNKIKEPFLFITNSAYVYKEDVSCKERDGDIKRFAEKYIAKKMRLIFVVEYPRFLELALILNTMKNTKILCLSYQVKKFIERAKSMIEWTGSKTLETFYREKHNPFEFDNIEFIDFCTKMKDFQILILIDDNVLSPVTSSVIHKYNTENTILVFLNEEKEEKFIRDSNSCRVYNFTGRYVEQTEEESSESSEFIEEDLDSSEEKDLHWSNFSCEVWKGRVEAASLQEDKSPQTEEQLYEMIYGKKESKQRENKLEICESEEGGEEMRFPLDKNFRNFDNYGEYVDLEKFKQKRLRVEEIKKEKKPVEMIYIEDKKLISSGFQIKCLTTTLNFSGTCDLNSIKMILQGMEVQKVLIIPSDVESAKMFFYSLLYLNTMSQYYLCRGPVNLSSDTSMSIVNLSADFLSIEYKNIGDDNIAQFKGRKIGNVIEYLGKPKDIMVANLEINEIKKKLIENNLKVEASGNILIVEKKTNVILEDNRIVLEGEHSDFYYYIRNILYQNIAMI
ncbi:putative cleavage and polyadenylation specificity factor subunit 2 [Nosema granulosis]|uniref:Cleavage and polyadenylation specificity factor subunit 2 n=1 Tax=Nosema granulosis TaxID=83296 RepID=A0A9P6H105_9MICR|nr:putative cleavage and polyadenylation specificity factor subunit 2 [Nosema granulosis]